MAKVVGPNGSTTMTKHQTTVDGPSRPKLDIGYFDLTLSSMGQFVTNSSADYLTNLQTSNALVVSVGGPK